MTPLPPPQVPSILAREYVDRGSNPDADLAGWIVFLATVTAMLFRYVLIGG